MNNQQQKGTRNVVNKAYDVMWITIYDHAVYDVFWCGEYKQQRNTKKMTN